MKTYKELKQLLGNRNSRKVKNNTYLVNYMGDMCILLHNTHILSFTPNGWVQYNTGGWYSDTTKKRMSSFGPCRVIQRKGEWFLETSKGLKPYRNGMCVRPSKEVVGEIQ